MQRILFFFLILFTLNLFGQDSLTIEDKIYNAIDAFVANPNEENLIKLNSFSKNISPKLDATKNKNAILALVVLQCNKAYYENQFGKTNQAISSYEKAWQLYQKNKLVNYDIAEYCLKPLGNLYTIIGNYDSAENIIKQYYFIANAEKNESQKIAAILNLSNVYQNSGRISEAIDLIEKTIQTEKLTATQKGLLLNNLGVNYLVVDKINQAQKNFETAAHLLKNEKNQSLTLSNAYRNLATIYRQKKEYNLASSFFEKAQKLFFETTNHEPRQVAKVEYEKALLLFEQKKITESSTWIQAVYETLIPNHSSSKSSLPNSKSLYAETILLDALDLQATILLEQNQPKKALEAYALSFQIEELFSSLFLYENTKIIHQIRNRNRIEKCIAIYYLLYQKEKNKLYIEQAFQLSEQTKSGVLKSYLSTKKTASREEKLHLEQLQNWNNEILKEQQKGSLADVLKINNAIKKQNELMLSLKKIRTKNQVNTEENIDLNLLFSKLEKDKAFMIYYFLGGDKTYSFTLENHQIKLQSIENNTKLKAGITQFLTYFNNPNAIANDLKGYNHFGNLVYKTLLLPSKKELKNAIIVPDGILNFLPFEALITKESSTLNFEEMHYFLHDFKIGYHNSSRFYLDEKSVSNNNKSILGVFPVFEKTNYELTFSKSEMQFLKNNFEGKFFENQNATYENFKKNASIYSILHLSTHATAGDTQTAASIKFYDQEILYSELYNLNINPDLVVLSACETGVGKLYKSEGAMSIARGFQFAGAKNLLFSLWKVNDYTTSVFMDYFYTNVKKGMSYFEANHQAKLDFLEDESISNAKKSPYYWSAFVYYGNIETTESLTNYYWAIIGLLLAIGLFFIFKRFRK